MAKPAPLGAQLRAARKAAGLTQTELAERMGTYQGHIGDLEHGRKSPSLATLTKFCEACGCGFTLKGGEFRLTAG